MKIRSTMMRLAGAAVITVAIAPWLGAGTALAAANDDSDCATRPDGVPVTATCVVLDENTGENDALHGETWAWRDAGNDLHVVAFPTSGLTGTDPVQLCVQESGPYSADFKCLGSSASRVYFGSDLTIVVDLDALQISATDPVYYSIHVNQGERTTVSSGSGGTVPAPTPTPSTPSTPPSTPATTPATTPVTPAASTPAASVLPTKAAQSPDTSVEGVKVPRTLPHTGGSDLLGLGSLSVGLLLLGGALLAAPNLAVQRSDRRH